MAKNKVITAEKLIRDARKSLSKIDQLFIDAAHWNRVRPNEQPINPDPDGEMQRARTRLQLWLKDIDAGVHRANELERQRLQQEAEVSDSTIVH